MSEYRWYVKQMWIGVEFQLADPFFPQQYGPYYQRELVGVIRRSGYVQQVGHFCHTYVSYLGKKRYAANAEARIFPFHSLQLDPGELPKKLELVWLGWCKGGNTPAFVGADGKVVELVGAGKGLNLTEEIPAELWPETCFKRGFIEKMWESQGMLRVEQEYGKMARKMTERRKKEEEKKGGEQVGDYDWVTQEMFDNKLAEIMDESPASSLLSVPGVAEIVKEHFNNDVLEELEKEREHGGG